MSAVSFDWKDPFQLNAQLQVEERAVRDLAATYAQQELMPTVQEAHRNEYFDAQIFKRLGALGLLGCQLPKPWGDNSVNHVGFGLVMREIERVDSGYRSALSVHASLVIPAVFLFGSREQQSRYLPQLVRGEKVGCFALTEPDAGSDPASMNTVALPNRGGYVLEGTKDWITNSPVADIFIIWAKLEGRITGFVLERGMKGLSTPEIEGKCSLRASSTGQIILNRVQVGKGALLPKASGLKPAFNCLNKARLGIAWGALGAAEFCWQAARDYCLERYQFARPLAANQLVQKKLADMQTEISLGLQGCLQASRLMDEGRCAPELISLIKRNSASKALGIARSARDMHGGNGVSDEYHIMRHLVNLESVNTYEGTEDIHALILGKAQTGIQAFF